MQEHKVKRLADRLEVPMLVASLLVIPAIIIEQTATDPVIATLAWGLNALIWTAFVVEYLVLISVSRDRWAYVRTHKLDLAIILLSPPFIVPDAMAGLRVFRVTRLARLARATRFARVMRAMRFARVLAFAGRAVDGANRVLRRHATHYVIAIALVLLIVGGSLFYWVESDHVADVWDGMWWALTTITTVGYGDISPKTGPGRLVGVVLMMVGIGLMAVITANIASWFVEKDRESEKSTLHAELTMIRQRLEHLEAMLSARLEAAATNEKSEAEQRAVS